MDLNLLLHRHQLALRVQGMAANEEERRAYSQFARDYFVQIQVTRTKNCGPNADCGIPT
jgi:hypothetical protein